MHLSVTFGGCTSGICYLGNLIIGTINHILVPVIFAVAFIVFLWGVANAYIISRGNSAKVKQGHELILWGLVGFFVMLSIWGLVNIVANSIGISGVGAPPTTTYFPYTYGSPTGAVYTVPVLSPVQALTIASIPPVASSSDMGQ